VEGQLGEVSLVRRGAVKAQMWSLGIVEIEVAADAAGGFANALVGSRTHFLIFDASPQMLIINKHIVTPSAFAIHADRYSLLGERAGERRASTAAAKSGSVAADLTIEM
jgi:hypothetical protein